MKSKRCVAINRRGERCSAFPLRQGRKCALHADQFAAAKLARRRKPRLIPKVPLQTLAAPQNAQDLARFISQCLCELRAGRFELDARTANSIAQLGGILLKSVEIGALEERVSNLEAQAAERMRPPGEKRIV